MNISFDNSLTLSQKAQYLLGTSFRNGQAREINRLQLLSNSHASAIGTATDESYLSLQYALKNKAPEVILHSEVQRALAIQSTLNIILAVWTGQPVSAEQFFIVS